MSDTRVGNTDKTLRWGILGTGGIAHRFAGALATSQSGSLVAVASRTEARADAFGDEFGVPVRHATYEGLLADPNVDAVYIALPNHVHARWTVLCAEAGKHILCEKPLANNFAEAMVSVEAARANDVFLMEAFMYRCHPQTAKLAELVRSGVIGEVRVIEAVFSFNMGGARPESTRQHNALGGGGIMDVGCYCASVSRLIAGAAVGSGPANEFEVKAAGHINPNNRVDEWAGAVVRYPGDIVAHLTCGLQVAVDSAVRVWGSEGHISVPNPWFPGMRDEAVILVQRAGEEEPERIVIEDETPLYSIEADTVARNLANRQAPYPCMTWDDSLANMRLIDDWRKDIGLVFDTETVEGLRQTVTGRPLRRETISRMTYGEIEGIDKPVSRIAMGTMVLREGGTRLACPLLDYFFEAGGRTIDTAYVYGSERPVGDWIKLRGVRDDVVLVVKGAHTPYCTPDDLTRELFESLDNLQTDYADLYMMHRDDPDVPVGEFVEVLNEHLSEGRIRAFGGSNWTVERLEAANAYAAEHGLVGFAAASPHFSLAEWNQPMWAGCVAATDSASRAWYERTQMPLLAWSSQASGFFTGRYGPEDSDNPRAANVVRTWFNDGNFQRLGRVRKLAANKGVTPTQIALAYVLNQPLNMFALIGPHTIEETRTSLAAVGVTLTASECSWLNLER